MVIAAYITRLKSGRFFGSFVDFDCTATEDTLPKLHNRMLKLGRTELLKRNFNMHPTKNPCSIKGYDIHWYLVLRREDIPNE